MSKFNRLINQLLQLQPSEMVEKHYAMLFKGKKIIAMSVNNYGSKVMGYEVPSIHAEMAAIAKVSKGPPYYGLRHSNHQDYRW